MGDVIELRVIEGQKDRTPRTLGEVPVGQASYARLENQAVIEALRRRRS